jgi:predicted alpha/beta superfamily hydrolase
MWKQVPRYQAEQVFHIEVPTIGDILEITVVEPFPGAASVGKLFPTLYLLDSRLTLDIVVGTKRLFDIFSGGALPLCYLVAIGYADLDIAGRRFRDYTPTKADLPPGLQQPLPFGTGGAASYLDVLRGEIIPHLERQYPLDPRERVLIGYSLSGRFATYALFSEPEAFGRYLIISPSLWWDRESAFAEEEAWARSNADLRAKLLVVGGDAEETPGGGWRNNLPDEVGLPLKQLTNMRELDRRLSARNYPSLRFKTALIPDGRHVTGFPAAIALGLVEIFAL